MHSSLLRFPKLYAKLIYLRKYPNFEKILYLKAIKSGDVVLDIGANYGYFTTLFSGLVSTCGEVHAFEPVPETYKLLLENTRRLMPNIKANNFAVGQKREKAVISYDINDSEKASLVHYCASMTKKTETDVIPLDDYVQDNDLRRLDFVKCDVEGYELQALRGMKRTLCELTPQLSIEVTINHKDRLSLFSFLKDLGYDSFKIIEKGYPDYHHCLNGVQDYFYLHAFSSKASKLRA
jgi:FkbM family methyltransferase